MDKPKSIPPHAKEAIPGLIMRRTRYNILDVNGTPIRTGDITDVPNANSTATLMFMVEQQCDMLHWHTVITPMSIPPYDYHIWEGK